jgi:PAS domain S-box-containing protein
MEPWITTVHNHSRLLLKNWTGRVVLLVFLSAIVLFPAVLVARHYLAWETPVFFTVVLIGLAVAVVLHARFLLLLQMENQKTVSTLDSTGREFKSIFDNALDGILILDNQGHCIDANPAAFLILRVLRNELVGHSIARFYADPNIFTDNWALFLEKKQLRGRAELLSGDGSILFVEFAASANYVPGRHVVILCDVTQRVHAERSLKQSDARFQQMATNIHEVFWMMDIQTKKVVYASKAYETITGRLLDELYEYPSSYREIIHPEDRVRVLAQLEEATSTGRFDEEFRIQRSDGALRWIWCKASAVAEPTELPNVLVGIALDITSRKLAEGEVGQHLAAAEAARAEAEVLRKATLTLTQNLRMDALLDTLLRTLLQIVPYDSASVLLTETDHTFLLARKVPCPSAPMPIIILDANKYSMLHKILGSRKAIVLEDTRNEPEWRNAPAFGSTRSWLCIPLIASGHLVGLLSVSGAKPSQFTHVHVRIAKSLALSAAIAINNARLYERAAIYASELELQLKRLENAQVALQQTQGRSREDA